MNLHQLGSKVLYFLPIKLIEMCRFKTAIMLCSKYFIFVMSYQVWFAYMLACWVISISPGAGAIASMSSGLNYGFRRGYWNAIGLQLALLVQIIIVAAGVGVLFATTPMAFLAVKWFGVCYLLYFTLCAMDS